MFWSFMLPRRSPLLAALPDNALTLFHGENLVYSGQVHLFRKAARPVDLHRVDFVAVAQAKVYPGIVGGNKAAAAEHVASLPQAAGGEVDRRTHCISRP